MDDGVEDLLKPNGRILMKRTLTYLGLLAAVASTSELASASAGDYTAFKLDGISNLIFAYRGGDMPALLALEPVDEKFDIVGVAKAHGDDLKFVMASMDRHGHITPTRAADNYIRRLGRDLTLDLDEVLAQLSLVGGGQVEKVTVLTGDQTKFRHATKGGADLIVIKLGDHSFGVYQKDDRLNVVGLEPGDGHYLAKRTIANYNRKDIERSIIGLTAANTSTSPAATIASSKTSGAGHGHREAVSA